MIYLSAVVQISGLLIGGGIAYKLIIWSWDQKDPKQSLLIAILCTIGCIIIIGVIFIKLSDYL